MDGLERSHFFMSGTNAYFQKGKVLVLRVKKNRRASTSASSEPESFGTTEETPSGPYALLTVKERQELFGLYEKI